MMIAQCFVYLTLLYRRRYMFLRVSVKKETALVTKQANADPHRHLIYSLPPPQLSGGIPFGQGIVDTFVLNVLSNWRGLPPRRHGVDGMLSLSLSSL